MKKVLKHSALVLTALALVACGNSKKASDTQFSFISQGIALYKEKVELIQIYELDTKQLIWIT